MKLAAKKTFHQGLKSKYFPAFFGRAEARPFHHAIFEGGLTHVALQRSYYALQRVLFAVLLFAAPAVAQTPSAGVSNLYAAGVSFNQSATPSVAGTALYAHQIDTSGTYAFTLFDALPNGTKPFTVSTNVGAGIAQRVATVGGNAVLIPTSAGISFTGPNTGWSWTTGAAVTVKLKHNWYVLPTVRVLKSSVNGGTGYQPILGVLVGWGK